MAYDKNTPANINESFSVSQPKITANFQEIDNLLDVDHLSFGVNQGLHKKVTLVKRTTAPIDPVTGAGEVSVYSKDNGGVTNSYMRLENSGTVFNITPDPSNHGASGSEILPSGLKMIWGSGAASHAGTVITFANGGFAAAVYQVIVSRNGAPGSVIDVATVSGATTKTQFTVESHNPDGTAAVANISYFAIGK